MMIELTVLPKCQHRYNEREEAQLCSCRSNRWVGNLQNVPFEFCMTCIYADRENRPVSSGIQAQPGQAIVQPLLGDMVKNALSTIGVTEERVTAWIGQPCGCKERQEKLNKLHAWAKEATKEGLRKLLGWFD